MKGNFYVPFLMVALVVGMMSKTEAQTGTVYGKVIDKETGETLPGAAVYFEVGGKNGTVTDLDGNFTLKLSPGTYDLKCSFISYQDFVVKGIVVVAGGSQKIDYPMSSSEVQLQQVIVEASEIRHTDASLIAMQKKSIAVQDGISAQQISRTGSSNAAESMKQMTGASVQDGKYLVMRGLGDRYSISQLNGLTMASADPYRNSSSLDLIPSSFIENIVTLKTFTPDQPGNFTGGNVNISTKSIPEKFMLNFSYTLGYNPISNLRNDFLGSEGDSKENFGYYGAKRDLPADYQDETYRDRMTSSLYVEARNPKNSDDSRSFFNSSSKGLSSDFVPEEKRSPLNQKYELSFGNNFKLFKKDFGFIAGGRYSRNYQMYNDAKVTTWINNVQPELFAYQDLSDNKSMENPQLGFFGNLSTNLSSNHQITGTIIYSNDAEIMGRKQSGKFIGQVSNSAATFNTNSIQYTQRELISYQLSGKHKLPEIRNIEVEWSGSYNKSKQDEPDLKYFAYTTVTDSFVRVDPEGNLYNSWETEYYLNNAEYARPYHFYRYLNDDMAQGRVDITIPVDAAGKIKVKTGAYYSSLKRDFKEYRFEMSDNNLPSDLRFTEFMKNNGNDFNKLFDPVNFGIVDTTFNSSGQVLRYQTGYHYVNETTPRNFYTGSQQIAAGYVMGIIPLSKKMKLVTGLRIEQTKIDVVSGDTARIIIDGEIFEPNGHIDVTDLLPSLNLIYGLTDKTNIRLSASQTVARPNLREISPFVQFDNKNGFFVLGNPSLKRTTIQNYDLRYEIFPTSTELLAVGTYVKVFKNPIVQAFNNATIPELIYINVERAHVYGVELEFRKSLAFVSSFMKDFSFASNFSYIYSKVDMPEKELITSQRFDSSFTNTTRPFVGQAPYIVNLILQYINKKFGNETALSFNVSGRKLYQIALVATPDIYEMPVPTLNFKTSQKLGKGLAASISVQNILNSKIRRVQEYHDKSYTSEEYELGTLYQFGISYNF